VQSFWVQGAECRVQSGFCLGWESLTLGGKVGLRSSVDQVHCYKSQRILLTYKKRTLHFAPCTLHLRQLAAPIRFRIGAANWRIDSLNCLPEDNTLNVYSFYIPPVIHKKPFVQTLFTGNRPLDSYVLPVYLKPNSIR